MDSRVTLEHANLSVLDLQGAIDFLTTAFPHFRVRGRGPLADSPWAGEWVHLGTDDTYLALQQARPGSTRDDVPYDDPGINHVGFVVDDVDALRGRLLEAGYREGLVVDPHPHRKRIYFHDPDGTEYEFIEYLSEDPAERNAYPE